MKVEIKKVNPNPYRDIKKYPINREKVDALKESIKRAGFWDNIVGRVKNGGLVEAEIGSLTYNESRWEEKFCKEFAVGKEIDRELTYEMDYDEYVVFNDCGTTFYHEAPIFQIVYGHHKLEAIRELYGEDYEFDLIIKDIDDKTMLEMMKYENIKSI